MTDAYIRSYPNFPKPGITYWDFTGLLADPAAFRNAVSTFVEFMKGKSITKIAAIEAKGFTVASAIAYETHTPLVLIRKPGLIPGEVYSQQFVKEYGTGEYQVKKTAFAPSDRVLIFYDIMAGEGATKAAAALIERSGATVAGCAYVIELAYLHGREQLKQYDICSLITISDSTHEV